MAFVVGTMMRCEMWETPIPGTAILSSYVRFRGTGGFKVSTETPFEIDFNPGSLNTLIEQSDRDSLIEQSDHDAAIAVVLFEIIMHLSKLCPTTPLPGKVGTRVGI